MAKLKTLVGLLTDAQGGANKLEIYEMNMSETDALTSMANTIKNEDGEVITRIFLSTRLTEKERAETLERELHRITNTEPHPEISPLLSRLSIIERHTEITISSVIIPERKVTQGLLVKSASVVWGAIVQEIVEKDWEAAFRIPPHVWEEIIAGAYSKAGFDEVILTPRSGDYGRDVIAIRKGIGCIKIIGSVKAYKPGHLVKHDDVRALLGVMSGEQDTSKGIITTTSDFAPRVETDPFIKPFLPTRLELMNGVKLHTWLSDLIRNAGSLKSS